MTTAALRDYTAAFPPPSSSISKGPEEQVEDLQPEDTEIVLTPIAQSESAGTIEEWVSSLKRDILSWLQRSGELAEPELDIALDVAYEFYPNSVRDVVVEVERMGRGSLTAPFDISSIVDEDIEDLV